MKGVKFDPDESTLKTIEGLAKIQCTQGEAAAVLGIDRTTFLAFLKRDLKARARWEAGLESGKASLRRNQFKLSETNAAMAIWLGKQYLGQREPVRYEEEHPEVPLGKKEIAQRAAEQAHEGSTWSSLVQ
jgi:hypothetical protein